MHGTRLLAVWLGAALAGIGLGCGESSSAPDRGDPATSSTRAGAALAEALGETDPFARARKLAELLPKLGPEVIPDVERRLDRSRAGLGGAEFELLAHFWASHDPSAASTWAFGRVARRDRIPAIHATVEVWAQADPAAALAGVTAATRGADLPSAEAARSALVRGWFQADRVGLEEYIRSLGSGIERERAVLAYAIALVQADGSEALMRWADAIPSDDETYKRSAYFHASSALAAFDPAAALRWCDTHCEGPYSVGMRQVIVLSRLNSGEDGGSVVEWVARAPETESNDQTLIAAYAAWTRRDREAAIAWMQQKDRAEAEPWLRKLFGTHARALAATSPAEAIAWAERVEADAERESLLVEIARAWRGRDAAAAEAWLATSPLSEQARENARKPERPTGLPSASSS